MKRILLLALSSICLAACQGGDDDRALPRLTEADVLAVVPPEWSLADWALAEDGAYMAVVTDSPRKLEVGTPRVVSVYAQGDAGPVEVARVASVFGGLELADGAAAALGPDEAGDRSVEVGTGGTSEAGAARVILRASGHVMVEQQGFEDQPAIVTSLVPADAFELIDIELPPPPPDYARPLWRTGPWRVPAGAIPAGWTVTGAAWSPDERYVALTSEPPEGVFASQFSIYDVSGDRLREVWRAANDYTALHAELVYKDINGDGTVEIVYEDSFGGTGWLNYSLQAVTIGDTVHNVEFALPIERSTTQSLEDLDGDGVYEWWATDASWELEGFCHACSPQSSFVLAWDGEKYADASRRFGDALLARSGWEEWAHEPLTCQEQDTFMAWLISGLLNNYNAGRTVEADAFLARIRGLMIDERLWAKRDRIVEVLETDPHAPYGIEWVLCEAPASG